MHHLSAKTAEESVRVAQAAFRKALSAWASDLLVLRREGLLLTRWAEPRDEPGFDSDRRVA